MLVAADAERLLGEHRHVNPCAGRLATPVLDFDDLPEEEEST